MSVPSARSRCWALAAACVAPVGIVALLATGCAGPRTAPPWQEPLGYRAGDVFPITIGRYGFPFVEVRVNGRPQRMVWDTGNMTGLLVSPRLAERLGLPIIGARPLYDADGSPAGFSRTYRLDSLVAFGQVWTDVPAQADARNDLDGLVGPRFVADGRFTLDYRRRAMAVSRSPLPPLGAGETVLPLVRTHDRGLIVVRGEVNGRPALIQIDTGKSRTVIDPEFARVLGLRPARDRLLRSGYRMDAVRLGPHTFRVAAAKAVRLAGLGEGLDEPVVLGVGSDLLRQVVLTVDYASGVALVGRS